MKETLQSKALYIGAGAGLVLFAIYGLLPGTFLGGALGLTVAGKVLGSPVTAGILARIIVTLSMVLGVMVAGTAFVVAGSVVGWVTGLAADALLGGKEIAEARKTTA